MSIELLWYPCDETPDQWWFEAGSVSLRVRDLGHVVEWETAIGNLEFIPGSWLKGESPSLEEAKTEAVEAAPQALATAPAASSPPSSPDSSSPSRTAPPGGFFFASRSRCGAGPVREL